ncbi:MAG: TetR/AcrR family transcriptional regulator [Acidimicrobiales bacterium]
MVTTVERGAGRRYRQKSAEERRAERRTRLLDAALDAFGTRGYARTSIEELCTAASVSTRSFYEEFRGREDVLTELHDLINARVFDAVIAALESIPGDDVAARAEAGARAYFGTMTADPRWARIAVVESVGVSPAMEAHRRATLERFAALIQAEADRLAAAGVVATRDFSLTARALVGVFLELLNTWSPQRDLRSFVDDVSGEAARLIVASVVQP